MEKAYILDTFASVILVLSVIAAGLMCFYASNSGGNGGSIFWVWGSLTFFTGLLQFATFGGAAEVIRRLVSIDETLKSQDDIPLPPTPNLTRDPTPEPSSGQISTPTIGRGSRQ